MIQIETVCAVLTGQRFQVHLMIIDEKVITSGNNPYGKLALSLTIRELLRQTINICLRHSGRVTAHRNTHRPEYIYKDYLL